MANAPRISAQDAQREVQAGAILVCAYEDDAKCRKLALDGSISLNEFESRDVPKDRTVIFY